ncbi:MAG: polysaccharide biosynthesis protein [Deltaproteobacteria bacterium]|nr:polysaccharide biosynthesis protein [Deltaproteobacteria bacterium]
MSLCLTPAIERITARITGRERSMFAEDLERRRAQLGEAIRGSRVLIAGGAGSIGSATLLELLDHEPAAVAVLDPSENNLAELLRTVRSCSRAFEGELALAPLDYGSPLARRYLASVAPFDWVLSFAALKHVRSERDDVSLLRMLEVNLLGADRFFRAVREHGHGRAGVFTVSTDKAACPVSLMGASKRALELLLWEHRSGGALQPGQAPFARATTARFANVAFSDGSLPWSFLQRLAKEQPLAAPGDVRRYLVSPREAGQLCLVATVLAPDRTVLVPRLDPARDLTDFVRVAEATLGEFGLTPERYETEAEARTAVGRERSRARYPLLVTRSDTSGEKDEEIFVAHGETAEECGLAAAQVVPAPAVGSASLEALLALIEDGAVRGAPVTKLDLIRALTEVVPDLAHLETGKNLDQKM